jgi:hypothetical protein
MEDRIALYAIPNIAYEGSDDPLNLSLLPATIVPGVTIEDTSSYINGGTFDGVERELGRHKMSAMQSLRYAIVHRYQPKPMDTGGESDRKAEALVKSLAACLILIRPMQQTASFIQGEIRKGKFQIARFDHPFEFIGVPVVQRMFDLRTRDLLHFQKVAADFQRVMNGEFWKFRMAVQFYEAGHYAHSYWKGKFSLWCSAVEALFTTQTAGHKGSLVARERVKWFLGPNTSIYAPGDFTSIDPHPDISIADVIGDLYELRNFIAHGDKVPDRFFAQSRVSFEESVSLVGVLHEALSFIIRASLLRILDDNLLPHFADGPASESYFGGNGLTDPLLRAKLKP